MVPIVYLPPEARRRQRRAATTVAEEGGADDRNKTWRRLMAQRMSDVEVVRIQLRAEAKELAEQWRREARKQRRAGNARRALFYYLAADAMEAWADKVFSATSVWPGL